MDWEQKEIDLPHRLHQWAHENKTFLLFLLAGGIGFFSLLAGITFYKHSRENKALELLVEAKKDPVKLRSLIEKYPKTEAGLLGFVMTAKKSFDEKRWEDCLTHYERLYKRVSDYPFFRILALHGQGTCLRGKGEFLESAKIFERAGLEPGHLDPLVSRFEMARSYQMANDPKALELFGSLLKEKNLASDLKEKIEQEIAWSSSKKDR